MAAVLKTALAKANVGSNPTLSAMLNSNQISFQLGKVRTKVTGVPQAVVNERQTLK